MEGKLDPVDAAMAKMFTSELHCETVDECLQLFGGWGYMWEYPIARGYAAARIVKIAGGSIEIMKTIIARQMYSQRGCDIQKNGASSWVSPSPSNINGLRQATDGQTTREIDVKGLIWTT